MTDRKRILIKLTEIILCCLLACTVISHHIYTALLPVVEVTTPMTGSLQTEYYAHDAQLLYSSWDESFVKFTMDEMTHLEYGEVAYATVTVFNGREVKEIQAAIVSREIGLDNEYIYTASLSGITPSAQLISLKITRIFSSDFTIIPLSCIQYEREGDYIFVLKERDKFMGKEWYVEKYECTVVDNDGIYASVTADPELLQSDKIVYHVSKPVYNGAIVRVNTNG